ncbi:uncharacterized protein LOC135203593 isoform X1 [Macrobrachium nipponense]|uniref:uncharacterized protein LOC135203593 isoform X1 n=1 Tax=Macrobrachium nipponense TaxID=159736 RepID=UPI0030C86E14
MGKNKRKMKEANGEDALSKRPRIKPEGEQAVSETLPVVRKDDKIRNGKPTLTKKGKWGKRKDTQNADENEKVSNEPALKKLKVENENVNDIKNKLGTNDEEPQSSADAAIPKKKKKKKKKKKQGRIIEASEGKEKTDKKVSDEPTLKKLKVENGNSSNEVLEVKKLEVNDKQQQLNADMATGKKKKKKGKKKQASISEANEVQKETKELGSPGSSVKEQGKKNKKKKNKKNKVEMGKMNQTITDIAKPSSGEMKSSNNAVVEQKNKKKVPKAEEASSATGKSQSKKNGSLDGSSKDSSNEAMISSPLKLNEAYGDEASRDEIIKCWSEGSPLQKDNGFKLLTEPFKCMYMPHFLQDGNFLQNVKEELSSLELHKKSNDLYKATNCQEAGCNAVLQDPCGHEVCRTHAPCAISHEDLTVWHHEACTICYDLVSQFLDGAAAVKEVALATLKAWVGGFGKNAPKGQPYILDKKLAVQIFPGGKATGYVDPAAAAPTIAYIQQQVEQALVGEGSQDVVADVATLDLNLEPMTATNCQEAGCNAIFQDPCGHEVCRTHAPCAISHEDLTVWHHEACTICYDLVSQFLDGAATVKEVALATLKAWVGGFGKNAPKGQPYILDKKLAVQIFPGGKATGYVDPAAAAPIIAYIQQQVEQALVGEGSQDIVADVATLDLNLEPMTVGAEDLLVEVSLLGAQGLPLGAPGSSSPVPSSSSSQGFTGSEIPTSTPAASVPPKVKGHREQKTASKKQSSSSRKSSASHTGAGKVKSKPSHSRGSRGKSSKEKVRAPAKPVPSPVAAFSAAFLQQVGETFKLLDTRFEQMFARISNTLNQSGQSIQNLSERVSDHDNPLAGLNQIPQADPPVAGTGLAQLPAYDTLPAFSMSNPWRVAAYAPFKDGMISIPECGTRRIEDFEFHPTGLTTPFMGYARLTETALNREDKIPRETVLYSRDQAQREWVHCLEDWDCSNTRLQAFKSPFTIYVTEEESPLPFTTKLMKTTMQAAMKDEPLPQLKEADPTSPLFPAFGDLWENLPATFTVGKLKPDCAMEQLGEKLPRLPDNLIQAEFDARTRLGRTLNSLVITEEAALTYASEPLFKILAKSQMQTVQADAYDFIVARRNCRKHVLQEATIRHEPNRLLASNIWGADLFPESSVNEVHHEASRLNQSLRARWGISAKRKQENPSSSARN